MTPRRKGSTPLSVSSSGYRRVVAIIVNDTFRPWERYADELARNTSDAEVTRRRNRYVVGTACAIGRLDGATKSGDALAGVPDELRDTVKALCAESVVAS